MNFYKDCFGGELFFQKVEELQEMAAQMPPEMKDRILHSSLTNGGIVIMGSDLNREKPSEGNTVQLCLNCDSEDELSSLFTKLSAGGEIVEPVTDMPWNAMYAELIDRYGKRWILNFSKE